MTTSETFWFRSWLPITTWDKGLSGIKESALLQKSSCRRRQSNSSWWDIVEEQIHLAHFSWTVVERNVDLSVPCKDFTGVIWLTDWSTNGTVAVCNRNWVCVIWAHCFWKLSCYHCCPMIRGSSPWVLLGYGLCWVNVNVANVNAAMSMQPCQCSHGIRRTRVIIQYYLIWP